MEPFTMFIYNGLEDQKNERASPAKKDHRKKYAKKRPKK